MTEEQITARQKEDRGEIKKEGNTLLSLAVFSWLGSVDFFVDTAALYLGGNS